MMTEPKTETPPARPEGGDLNAAFEKASNEPRGDWGNVSFRILDDDEEEETGDGDGE